MMDQSIDDQQDSDVDSENERREAEEAAFQQIYYQTYQSAFDPFASTLPIPQTRPVTIGEDHLVRPSMPLCGMEQRSKHPWNGGKNITLVPDDHAMFPSDKKEGPKVHDSNKYSSRSNNDGLGEEVRSYSMLLKLGINDGSDSVNNSEEDEGLVLSEEEVESSQSLSPVIRKPLARTRHGHDAHHVPEKMTSCRDNAADRRSEAASAGVTSDVFNEVITLSDSDESEDSHLGKTDSSCVILSSCGVVSSDENSCDVVILDNTSPLKNPVKRINSSERSARKGFFLDKEHSSLGDIIYNGEYTKSPGSNNLVENTTTDGQHRNVTEKAGLKELRTPPSSYRRPMQQGLTRYFNGHPNEIADNTKCSRCCCLGHSSKKCPESMKLPMCVLCGVRGHASFHCPHKLCFNCDCPGHQTRECTLRYQAPYAHCSRCMMQGHMQEMCPDQWRQYHLTTETGELVTSKISHLNTLKTKSCYNCGRKGHFGHMCKEPLMSSPRGEKASTPTTPLVCKYQILRRTNQQNLEEIQRDRQVKTASLRIQSLDGPVKELPSPRKNKSWVSKDKDQLEQKNTRFRLPSFYQKKSRKSLKEEGDAKHQGRGEVKSIFAQRPSKKQAKAKASKTDSLVCGVTGTSDTLLSNGGDHQKREEFKLSKNERKKRSKLKKEQRKVRRKMKKRAERAKPIEWVDPGPDPGSSKKEEIKIHIRGQEPNTAQGNSIITLGSTIFPLRSKRKNEDLPQPKTKRKKTFRRKTEALIEEIFQPLVAMKGKRKSGGRKKRKNANKAGGKKTLAKVKKGKGVVRQVKVESRNVVTKLE